MCWPKPAAFRSTPSRGRQARISSACSVRCRARAAPPMPTILCNLRKLDPFPARILNLKMTLKFTILGCGSSGGVPRPALGWGACDPNNPKNRRRRTSLLVEKREAGGVTRILVDTSPDLREQLLDAEVDRLDAVLHTHEHADHTHGVDDLRALYIKQRRPIDVYLDERAAASMHTRFDFCSAAPPGREYPPIVGGHRLTVGTPVAVSGQGGSIAA